MKIWLVEISESIEKPSCLPDSNLPPVDHEFMIICAWVVELSLEKSSCRPLYSIVLLQLMVPRTTFLCLSPYPHSVV